MLLKLSKMLIQKLLNTKMRNMAKVFQFGFVANDLLEELPDVF